MEEIGLVAVLDDSVASIAEGLWQQPRVPKDRSTLWVNRWNSSLNEYSQAEDRDSAAVAEETSLRNSLRDAEG